MNAQSTTNRPTLTLKRPKQIINNKPLPSVTQNSDEQLKKMGGDNCANRPQPRANVLMQPARKEPAMWCRRGVDPNFVGYVLTKDQRKAIDKMLEAERLEREKQERAVKAELETKAKAKAANLKRAKNEQENARAIRENADRTLRKLYPVWNECLPLALNEHPAIIAAIRLLLPDSNNMAAKDVLIWHVNSRKYLQNVTKGGNRYTLDGEISGQVRQIEIDHSLRRLATYKAKGERMKSYRQKDNLTE